MEGRTPTATTTDQMKICRNTRKWNGEHQTWIRYNARSILGLDHNQYYETWFSTAKLLSLRERGIGFTLVDRPA